jgi:hypothetical protein
MAACTPGIEIISRDRASAYAEAARRAAPGVVQVADRWHLLQNLSEALRYALEPHHRLLSQVAAQVTEADRPAPSTECPSPVENASATRRERSRERRHASINN